MTSKYDTDAIVENYFYTKVVIFLEGILSTPTFLSTSLPGEILLSYATLATLTA